VHCMSQSFRSRTLVIAVAAVLVAGLVGGLSGALADSSSPSPAGKVVMRVGWLADPDSLNPFIGTVSSAYVVWYMNYDPLVGLSYADLTPTKGDKALGLATDWTVSADQESWTFTLRKDATFQDGVPVTAKDVAFTYNYIIDNDLENFTSYTEYVKHVTVVDDYTVRFDCTQPKASMLSGYVPILPEHIWSKISPKAAANTFANKPPIIGSGPFQCVEMQKNDFVRMVANKNYWGGAPKIDEVIFQTYQNADNMASELRTGAIDACSGILPAGLQSLQNVPGVTARPILVNGYDELGFNCYTGGPSLGNPVLTDVRFRQALNYAVDLDKINEFVYHGYGAPGDTMITPGYYKNPDWHWTPPADIHYVFDPAKAKQLLDAAGYTDTNGDGIRDYKGKPISLRLWSRQESPNSQAAARLLTGWFRDIGLKIQTSSVDTGTLNDKLYNYVGDTFKPDYDMFLWGWYADIDPGIMLSYFTTKQVGNWSDCAWSNKEYDDLYLEQARTLDPTKRKQIIDRMQEIYYRESPYIILNYSNDIEGWRTDKWEGWITSPSPSGNVVFSPYGAGSFLTVGPKTAATVTTSGGNATLGIVVAVIVAVIVAVVVWLLLRRRRTGAIEE
jgi:peptide/nickel transport system substrate-binding protein